MHVQSLEDVAHLGEMKQWFENVLVPTVFPEPHSETAWFTSNTMLITPLQVIPSVVFLLMGHW